MEYLEGETLEACLERGALPLDGALRYATQISDALDRAHRAEVTHRDTKPGKIILHSRWRETSRLRTGQIHREARPYGRHHRELTHHRRNGAVVYEMVTGKKAFQGADPSQPGRGG